MTRWASSAGRVAGSVTFGILVAWLASVAGASDATAPVLEAVTESGPVIATVRLTPAQPRIGDSLVLVLEASAAPDVELLMPEFGEALDRFSIVDFSRKESASDDGGILSRQRYTLASSRSGEQTIPPLLIEFVDRREGRAAAPEGEDAYELLTEPLTFQVESALPDDAPLEFRPALTELGPLEVEGSSTWRWAVAAAGVLALAGAVLWLTRGWRSRARRRSAYEIARVKLDALLMAPRPTEGGMDAFFVALSNLIRRYLEDRFGLRSPELTTEEFLDALIDSPDLVRSHQELLRDFLRRADLVKFAHYVPTPADVEESLDTARRFLEMTRDEPASSPSPSPSPAGVARA